MEDHVERGLLLGGSSGGGTATTGRSGGGHGGRGAHTELAFESFDELGGFQQGQPADLFN